MTGSAPAGKRIQPYCVIVRLTAHHASAVALLEALRELRSIVLDESGTVQFAVHRASDDPLVIWVYERYSSEGGYQAHRQRLIDTGLEARIGPYVVDREVFPLALDWAK
jgi:quinol monooxygenase YgiN